MGWLFAETLGSYVHIDGTLMEHLIVYQFRGVLIKIEFHFMKTLPQLTVNVFSVTLRESQKKKKNQTFVKKESRRRKAKISYISYSLTVFKKTDIYVQKTGFAHYELSSLI